VDEFSYLSVLLSIVLGLGITQLLTALGRLIQARERVRMFWPAPAWAVLLLVTHVQTWWTMFGLRDQAAWTFFTFLLVLLQPVLLYLLAALVLPDFGETADPGEGTVDLRRHYFRQARWFFGLALALLAVSVLKDVALDGELPDTPNLLAHLLFAALWGTAAVTRRERYHLLLAPLSFVLFTGYVALLFLRME
jgi:hypothetical protein